MADFSFELHYLSGPDAGKRIPLADSVITLGRSRKNTVVVDDPSISRTHLKFQVDDQKVLVEDGGSSHGTSVNGTRIDSVTRLNDKDVIQAGDQRFEILFHHEDEDADEKTIFSDPTQMKEQFEEARQKSEPPPPAPVDNDPEEPTRVAPKDALRPSADDTVQHAPKVAPPQAPPPAAPKSPPLPAMQTGDDEDFMDDDATNILEPDERTRIIGQDMPSDDRTRIIQTNDQTRILQAPAAAAAPPPVMATPTPPAAAPAAAGGSKLGPLWFLCGLATGAVLMLALNMLLAKPDSNTYFVTELPNTATVEQWNQVMKDASEKGWNIDQVLPYADAKKIIFSKSK